MITIDVERTSGATTRVVRVSAPSIERALVLAGSDRPNTSVKVLFPIDAEAFFAPVAQEQESLHRRAADLAARLLCEELLDEQVEREMARDLRNAELAELAHTIADAGDRRGLDVHDEAVLRDLETELGTSREDLLEKESPA